MFEKLITDQFTRTVDDIILTSENDANFKEVIKWVDMQSVKNGISFYEMVYAIKSDIHLLCVKSILAAVL
jgi:hypothetical protein